MGHVRGSLRAPAGDGPIALGDDALPLECFVTEADRSAAGAGGAEAAVGAGPTLVGGVGPEVAGVGVLVVGDWRCGSARDGGDRLDERVDVVGGGREPGAGAHCAGYAAPVAAGGRRRGTRRRRPVEVEQAEQVRVGAEAAVTDADGVLGAEAGGDERVRTPSTTKVATGRPSTWAPAPRRRTPSMDARPSCRRAARASSWARIAGQPIRPARRWRRGGRRRR